MAFDKSADAVIRLDQATAYFDEHQKLITDRRIRLKILKEKGIQRGNIRIHFYSGKNFASIYDLQALLITPGRKQLLCPNTAGCKKCIYLPGE